MGRLFVGIFIVLVGLSMFIEFPFFKFAIAALIIWLGVRVLSGRGNSFGTGDDGGETEEDEINRVMIFSGARKKFVSDNFKGGNIVAVFGGGDFDLSEVKTKSERVNLDVVAVFGGVKLIVPRNWSVRSEGIGILGGFDSRVKPKEKSTEAVVKGVAILGGVEVVNE